MLDLAPLARGGRSPPACSTSPATPRPSTRPGSGPSSPTSRAVTCARFADVRRGAGARAGAGGLARPGRQDWTASLDRAAYTAACAASASTSPLATVYQANLCRVLSAPTAGRRRRRRADRRLAARHTPPYAGTIRLPAHGVRWPPRRPSCSCAAAASRRVRADQGHRSHRGGPAGEGLRRERDDRGPGAQRPRPRLRHRDRHRGGPAERVEKHPGLVHLVSTVTGRAAPGRRLAGPARGHVPAGLRHRRAQVERPEDHRRPGDGAARAVLRSHRAGSTPTPARELAVGHPDVLGRARAGCASAPAPGSPGVGPRAGMGGDRAQGPAARRVSVGERRGRPMRTWVNGRMVDESDAVVRLRPRADRGRRHLRDRQGHRRKARSRCVGTSSGSTGRRRAWNCLPDPDLDEVRAACAAVARRQPGARAAAHHLHRRHRAPGLRPRRRRPDPRRRHRRHGHGRAPPPSWSPPGPATSAARSPA